MKGKCALPAPDSAMGPGDGTWPTSDEHGWGRCHPLQNAGLSHLGCLWGGTWKKSGLSGGPSLLPRALGRGKKIITIFSGIEGSSLVTHFTAHPSKKGS